MSLFGFEDPESTPAPVVPVKGKEKAPVVLDLKETEPTIPYIGHEEIELFLSKSYQEDRMPHALIFSGPKGVGKQRFARRLVEFLLSQPLLAQDLGPSLFGGEPDIDTAPQSEGERFFDVSPESAVVAQMCAGSHPDFLLLPDMETDEEEPTKAKTKTQSISVSQIRRVSHFLRLTKSQSAYRCVIIDDAHEMTIAAQNSLLKVLEEPPAQTVLILVTDRIGRLLPTILSRCRQFEFRAMSDEMIESAIRIVKPDLPAVQRSQILKLSKGSIGRAIDYIQKNALKDYLDLLDLLKKCDGAADHDVLTFCERVSGKEQHEKYQLIKEFVLLWIYKLNHYVSLGQIPYQIVDAENDFLLRMHQYKYPQRVHDLWVRVVDLFDQCERYTLDRKLVLQQVLLDMHHVLRQS